MDNPASPFLFIILGLIKTKALKTIFLSCLELMVKPGKPELQ